MAMVAGDAGAFIEQLHHAWGEFVKGDPEPAKRLFSRQDDVSLGNPFGSFVRGWDETEATMERAASLYRDGEVDGFEVITSYGTNDLVCVAEIERYRAKLGGSSEVSAITLRVTSVLRRENDGWRIVHRHADPITTPRGPESVTQTG